MSKEPKKIGINHAQNIELEKLKHEHKIKELQYLRSMEVLKHQQAMELFRITNAELNKREQYRAARGAAYVGKK